MAAVLALSLLFAASCDDSTPGSGAFCDKQGATAGDGDRNPLECTYDGSGRNRWWVPTSVWDFATEAVRAEWEGCLAKVGIAIDVQHVGWGENADPLVRLRSGEEFEVLGTDASTFAGTVTANGQAEEAEQRVGAHGSSTRAPGTPYDCD
jgi:hypothetical protein